MVVHYFRIRYSSTSVIIKSMMIYYISGEYGFVIAVTTIDHIGNGVIDQGQGSVNFPVKYKAIVFRPFKGEVIYFIVLKCILEYIVYTVQYILYSVYSQTCIIRGT